MINLLSRFPISFKMNRVFLSIAVCCLVIVSLLSCNSTRTTPHPYDLSNRPTIIYQVDYVKMITLNMQVLCAGTGQPVPDVEIAVIQKDNVAGYTDENGRFCGDFQIFWGAAVTHMGNAVPPPETKIFLSHPEYSDSIQLIDPDEKEKFDVIAYMQPNTE